MEQHVARLEQRVDDLVVDVRALAPLVIAHAEMKVVLRHMEAQLADAHKEARAARVDLGELREDLIAQAKEQRKESKSAQRWLIGTILSSAGLIILAIQVLGGLSP